MGNKEELIQIRHVKGEIFATTPFFDDIHDFLGRISQEVIDILDIQKDNLNLRPVRAQTMVIFSALEALFVLYLAYVHETSDRKKIMALSMKNNRKHFKDFINIFILTKNNTFYKKNIQNYSNITSGDLLYLRNSLSHMFSLDSVGYLTLSSDVSIRKYELGQVENISYLSPSEFFELLKSAHYLMYKFWSNELIKDIATFSRKMQCVKSVVRKFGTKFLYVEE